MPYHNLKLVIRNIRRHKTFSFINILGLVIGISSCILIGLYAFQELSFDHFHAKHKNIYRVNKLTNGKNTQAQRDGITPGQLVPAIRKTIPEIERATRFRPWFNEMLVAYDTIRFKLDDVAYADEDFLQVFDFPLVKGDQQTALLAPFTAVVTESVARKYFKDDNPIGKTLRTLNDIDVTITGVSKDIPQNSSIRFTMLISWGTTTAGGTASYFSWMNTWNTQVNFSFVQVKQGSDPVATGNKISTLLHSNFPAREFEYEAYLQPLDKIHLYSADIQFANQFQTNSSRIVFTLLIIAGIILLIACFNFINLSTAGALGRAKETGIQKVLGATKMQLVRKYFGESFVLCLLAMLTSLGLVFWILPLFNKWAETNIDLSLLYKPVIIAGLLLLLFIISMVAGIYPAIFLARFRSTDVFRNIVKAGKDSLVRKSLVTTQFVLSIGLITGTLIVQKQTRYIMTKDLGFDKEQVLVMQIANTGLEKKSQELANLLKQHPGIISVSVTNRVPGQAFNGYGVVPEGHTLEEHIMSDVLETDAEFVNTYNIQMAEGRYFSPQMPTDTTEAIVINQAMAKFLNWREPIGKSFEIYEERKGKIIGVIKDLNIASLRELVQPLAIVLKSNPMYLSVKLKPEGIQSSLAYIAQSWKQLEPIHPFDYFFMDEQMGKFYKSDQRLLNVLGIFAAIAICIACMGLFGLSMYTARQRIKEIGIRKVLGASVGDITTLLSKDFLKLVFIAVLIASPVAWIVMNKWLQDFAYRINISWWVFGIAGVIAFLIALLTVSLQAIKAAIANPVESLRTE